MAAEAEATRDARAKVEKTMKFKWILNSQSYVIPSDLWDMVARFVIIDDLWGVTLFCIV